MHVEGSLPGALVRKRARAAGDVDLAAQDALFSGDLESFLGYLDRSCRIMSTSDDLERVAEHIAESARTQGVLHTEAIVNPSHWGSWRGRLDEFIAALGRGFSRAERRGAPWTQLSLSVGRGQSAEDARFLVEWIAKSEDPRVVALSIDGNELVHGSNTDRFAGAFEFAKERGIHRTVHAGESSGADGVAAAVLALHAERIDHGFRAIENPEVVELLRSRRITLNICPTSNRALGGVPANTPHPAGHLVRAGVRLTVGTDDPELFGTSVVDEYLVLAREFGWGAGEMADLARSSFYAAFIGESKRAEYLRLLDDYLERSAVRP